MAPKMFYSTEWLAEAVRDARERTFEIVADLSDEQLMGPRLSIVNPLRWEIGHLAWFQEFWGGPAMGGRSGAGGPGPKRGPREEPRAAPVPAASPGSRLDSGDPRLEHPAMPRAALARAAGPGSARDSGKWRLDDRAIAGG